MPLMYSCNHLRELLYKKNLTGIKQLSGFFVFFLSEFYQNADGTREPEKEILFKVCSSRPSRRSLDYIRAHKKYQHRAVKLLECFVLFELRRHY